MADESTIKSTLSGTNTTMLSKISTMAHEEEDITTTDGKFETLFNILLMCKSIIQIFISRENRKTHKTVFTGEAPTTHKSTYVTTTNRTTTTPIKTTTTTNNKISDTTTDGK